MDELETPKGKKQFELGQDLSELSIEELAETVRLLQQEIERLEAARLAKSDQMAAAESFFKAKG